MNNEMKKVENNLNNDILDTIIGAITGSPDNICVNDTNNTKFDFSDLDLDLSDFYKIGVFDRDSDFDSKKYMENEILPLMLKKEIPQSYHPSLLRNLIARDILIKLQGFALVSEQWINPLVYYLRGHKCLEIMAGLGTISSALQKRGVDIIATDNKSWDKTWKTEQWTDVKEMDAVKAIKKYGPDVDYIIMSWAYMDDTAYECLQAMRKANPECKMIVLGEPQGGCTANDLFFDSVELIEDPMIDIEVGRMYQQWFGIHDYIEIVK